eukprot:Blabericola_migrator_1__8896@NODE_4702_length_1014_cov_22_530095_g2608_i1_p1_GENE_NODE_4702_length_1014_cov_22_530095_g2608_i1NODE_4702_length_1014_cov_22_530095_g2608_i1_p1_ORF_typecomplete_len257_score54_22RNA_pol_Rpb6/PF01192_22/0_22DuffyBP_N/PF12377_8/1_8DuffyBP_N/PF12377_8/7_1e02_NODE_4702_length_1014_cov_22_530095_g2608_i1167937
MCRVIVGNKIDLAHRVGHLNVSIMCISPFNIFDSKSLDDVLKLWLLVTTFNILKPLLSTILEYQKSLSTLYTALRHIDWHNGPFAFRTLAIQIRAQQKHEHKSDSKIDKSKFRLEASSDYVEGSIYNATNSNVCCGYNLRKLSESFSTRSKQPSIALEEVAESESSQQSTDCASPAKKGDMSKTKIQKNPIFITTESPIDQAPIQSPQNLLEIHDKVRRTLKIQDHTMLRMPSKINEANDYGKRVSRRSDTCLTNP